MEAFSLLLSSFGFADILEISFKELKMGYYKNGYICLGFLNKILQESPDKMEYHDKSRKKIKYNVKYIIIESDDKDSYKEGDIVDLEYSHALKSDTFNVQNVGFISASEVDLQKDIFDKIKLEICRYYYEKLLQKHEREIQKIDKILEEA